MIFLSSPYSGTKEQQEQRYRRTCECAAMLFNLGRWCVSPIVHWHEVALRFPQMQTDADMFHAWNRSLLTLCTSVYVLELPGWRESKGVALEIEWARELSKPLKRIAIDDNSFLICDWNMR